MSSVSKTGKGMGRGEIVKRGNSENVLNPHLLQKENDGCYLK